MPAPLASDADLIGLLDRVAERDTKALHALYQRTAGRLHGLALRVVRRPEWAEDVLQESYLTIWRSASDYRASLSPPMAWMGVIVRSRALDLLRRQRAEGAAKTQQYDQELADAWPSADPGPQDLADASEQAWLLHQCLQQLSPPLREALSLAYLRELSHAELARQLAQPLGTIKTWIRRGLDKLRACMERAG